MGKEPNDKPLTLETFYEWLRELREGMDDPEMRQQFDKELPALRRRAQFLVLPGTNHPALLRDAQAIARRDQLKVVTGGMAKSPTLKGSFDR